MYTQRRSQGAAHGAQAAPKKFVPPNIQWNCIVDAAMPRQFSPVPHLHEGLATPLCIPIDDAERFMVMPKVPNL